MINFLQIIKGPVELQPPKQCHILLLDSRKFERVLLSIKWILEMKWTHLHGGAKPKYILIQKV